MTTVCVPSEGERAELAGAPGVDEIVVWNGTGDAPAGIAEVRFLLAPYMGQVFSAEAIAAMPRLEVIQLLSAGVTPWLDRVPPGVKLSNGRGIHGGSTAELAVAGLLSLLRGLPGFASDQALGRWQERRLRDLDGAEVLLLGAGDINQRVAAALSVFGARCTFVARTAREHIHGIDELPALLPGVTAVVLALPQTEATRDLVDADFLAAMPDDSILVNVARGQIVDTNALLAETASGRLSAFLDVTDPEPLPADHPLWQVPTVQITPHVGGGTSGWHRRAMALVRDQLARYAAGEPLINLVTGDY